MSLDFEEWDNLTSESISLDSDLEELSIINNSNNNIMNNNPDSIESGIMESSSENSTWCDSTESYINNLIEKAKEEQEKHSVNKRFYQQAKHGTGIPAVFIGVVMGAINQETPDYIQKIAFLSNSVIVAFSYYFDFGGKYLVNKKSYDEYTKLINHMLEVLSLPRNKRPNSCKETIDNFSKDFMRILSSSP